MPLAGLSDPFHKIQINHDYNLNVKFLNDFIFFEILWTKSEIKLPGIQLFKIKKLNSGEKKTRKIK